MKTLRELVDQLESAKQEMVKAKEVLMSTPLWIKASQEKFAPDKTKGLQASEPWRTYRRSVEECYLLAKEVSYRALWYAGEN